MSYVWNKFTPIKAADFTSVGTGLTLADTKYGVNFTKASGASAHNVAGMYISAPTAPYTITSCIQLNGNNADTGITYNGLGWSDGTKYVLFTIVPNETTAGTLKVIIGKYTNSTTFSANYQNNSETFITGNNIWLQIVDDNTNRLCKVSRDGVNFVQVHSIGRTDFLTATRVGAFTNPYSAATNFTIPTWKAT